MAPELLIGEEIVSLQSDIWSLGMVMLEVRFKNVSDVDENIENSERYSLSTYHSAI